MLNRFWKQTSLTTKSTILAFALMAMTLTAIIGAKSAIAATLKPVSVISGDTLTVGDLFDGVTRNADYVIGAAPQPGHDITLNARTLYRIATALDISWRPTSSSDQIVVRRQAAVVSYDEIEKTIRSELKNKGVTGKFNLSLTSGKPTIILPQDLPPQVEVSSIDYDVQKDYFRATLVAPSTEHPVQKITVAGMVERLVTVPVLRNNLQNGDVIGANDIEMIEVPQKSLQHDVMLNADDMIGLTPRRMAYAGKFILNGTLDRPQLVERGDPVNITFHEGTLILTAKGKALQSGAKGDLVRVTNINSSRTIDAIVTAENQVVVK
ncbi:MAG: flagellar basal body P-ring formation chaperone FlgA [Alphaproteobacteria bacterium]|nr:flagellar basal body P-ring formation chaperone FlgA [Alphaproteobacteria bacterium]